MTRQVLESFSNAATRPGKQTCDCGGNSTRSRCNRSASRCVKGCNTSGWSSAVSETWRSGSVGRGSDRIEVENPGDGPDLLLLVLVLLVLTATSIFTGISEIAIQFGDGALTDALA